MFRVLLGTCAVAVTVLAVLVLTRSCTSVLMVLPPYQLAILFDECTGVVFYQPLPPLPNPSIIPM